MNLQRLFLLLSLLDDYEFFESWDDDWDYLHAHDFISLDDKEIPSLTDKGKQLIAAVHSTI